jgi:hypothetical protein
MQGRAKIYRRGARKRRSDAGTRASLAEWFDKEADQHGGSTRQQTSMRVWKGYREAAHAKEKDQSSRAPEAGKDRVDCSPLFQSFYREPPSYGSQQRSRARQKTSGSES